MFYAYGTSIKAAKLVSEACLMSMKQWGCVHPHKHFSVNLRYSSLTVETLSRKHECSSSFSQESALLDSMQNVLPNPCSCDYSLSCYCGSLNSHWYSWFFLKWDDKITRFIELLLPNIKFYFSLPFLRLILKCFDWSNASSPIIPSLTCNLFSFSSNLRLWRKIYSQIIKWCYTVLT